MHLLEIVYLSKKLENRTMFLRLKILQGKTFVYVPTHHSKFGGSEGEYESNTVCLLACDCCFQEMQ